MHTQYRDTPRPVEPEPYISDSTKRLLTQLGIVTSLAAAATFVLTSFAFGYVPAKRCIERGGTPSRCEQELHKVYETDKAAGGFFETIYTPARKVAYKLHYKREEQRLNMLY